MSSLRVLSIVIILCQTLISILMAWWTLNCRFTPNASELQEVTLIKLLYLYDPEACGKLYFYNITLKVNNERRYRVIWPVKNSVASDFRNKIRLWLCLHVAWLILGVANLTHGRRPCGFYAALVPFTITGLSVLLVDLLYTGLFLKDIGVTNNEIAIMEYINSKSNNIRWINKPHYEYTTADEEDTSWIALLFAYGSCRGIVQWFLNFWIVKDNYFEGLNDYHRHQKEMSRRTMKV